MATIIMGHGNRIDGEAKTFVPAGTNVRFYGRDGQTLPTTNALAAVAQGAIGAPSDQYGAGEEIWNYHLYAEDDKGIAQYMSLDPEGNTMVFVGPDVANDTPLCTDVLGCQQHGEHTCDGIFGTYRGDLVVLACRGIQGAASTMDMQLGGDADDPTADMTRELSEWVTGFAARAKADPDAAEQEFDALPEGTKVMLSAYDTIGSWNEARWVRWYADQGDFDGFIGQLKTSDAPAARVTQWFRDVPAYGDSLYFLIAGKLSVLLDEWVSSGQSPDEAAFEQTMRSYAGWIEQQLGDQISLDRLQNYPAVQQVVARIAQLQQQQLEQAQGGGQGA